MLDVEIKNIILGSSVLKQVLHETDFEKNILIKGLAGSLKSLFLSILFEQKKRPIFYITADDEQEEVIREDLEIIIGANKIAYLPKIRTLAHEKAITDVGIKSQFLSALEQLVERQRLVTIISARNIALKFPSPDYIRKSKIIIEVGKEYDFNLVKERLIELGFNRENVVETLGEMSVRGGIIDVYPFSRDYPYRIEFFGNTIESIRIFDPATQRSINHVSKVVIYPQYPEELQNINNWPAVSLLEYMDESTIIFLDETEIIKRDIEELNRYQNENDNINSEIINKNIRKTEIFNYLELNNNFAKFTSIAHNSLLTDGGIKYYNFSSSSQESLKGNFQVLKQKIQIYCHREVDTNRKSTKLFFLCDSANQVERIEDIFNNEGISCDSLTIGYLGINQGFIFNEVGLVVFTDNQFYGRPIRWRRRKKVHRGLTLQQLHSLTQGDFVVHVDHGIGQYQGLKKITVQEHERECLSISYRDGDFLYVPLDRMDRVQKYSAKDGAVPSLSKLGSKDWDRLKQKTKKHIKNIAKELIDLYAKRKTKKGFAFSKDSLWQKELEASFEYEDTPDQSKATEEIKQDMENEVPMDRLVCGDVGYGKTEVAVRAAFKATYDSKQVAILVPTTVLALQHFNLFQERLSRFPIKIDMLSRFRTNSEQRRIIELLKEGRLDIVIGTHRLLSNDVQFKNLGLVIVDEEHRFGVKNKERLKALQVNVDVLSMSATPIPRTLNMAMLGIRDMSLIATPPRNRLPIHTEIATFEKKLIRLAILKEIERGGQVFFVHNRVQTIDTVANLLRRLVPEVTFGIAHGQMDERRLEKVMWDFATKKFQCLISTMIIESGLDIPNVNTMIINRADRFGLSQLYQLRGRVGRSTQRAFAYLLVPPVNLLNKNALKRLQIIEEYADLGSGFNIAMRDLEIRGAGNIFGAEQSGHIMALGFELYTKIIEEAIQELNFEREGKLLTSMPQKEEIRIEIHQDAYLPDDYIEQPELKVDIYRRLANVKDLKVTNQIKEEVVDRFGKLPQPAINLFNLVDLKIIGSLLDFKMIKFFNNSLVAYFSKYITISGNRELIENKICSIMQKAKGKYYFVQEGKDDLGIHIEIPHDEVDPIQYGKNFLIHLI